MNKLLILPILLFPSLPALAQSSSTIANPPVVMHEIQRDLKLEKAAFSRKHNLKLLLQPKAKAKLDRITRKLLTHVASSTKNINLDSYVQKEVNSKFTGISNEQSNLLSFYVLAEVARKMDDMQEMSEMDSLRLQIVMERRSKVISTLSNILKKISQTQDTLVQNLK